MTAMRPFLAENNKKKPENQRFSGKKRELIAGFEPATSSLPRMRSTY